MTPLQIEILLWYHCRAADYRDGDFTAPAVREAIDDFRGAARLLEPAPKPNGCRAYRLSDRGEAFVKRLCETPLPVCRWVFEDGAP